jgi:hypothetical protein
MVKEGLVVTTLIFFENQDDDDDEVHSSTSGNDAPISELMYSCDGSREGPGR